MSKRRIQGVWLNYLGHICTNSIEFFFLSNLLLIFLEIIFFAGQTYLDVKNPIKWFQLSPKKRLHARIRQKSGEFVYRKNREKKNREKYLHIQRYDGHKKEEIELLLYVTLFFIFFHVEFDSYSYQIFETRYLI